MSDSFSNARLDTLLRQYTPGPGEQDSHFLHWVCIPAILFAVLGMLFAINFGIALIAIAAAILFYYRFGYRVAAGMAGLLLGMLVVWIMVMPSHHLVAASIGIFLAALAGQILGGMHAALGKNRLAWHRQVVAGPVYAMVMLRRSLQR
jgi:uncharacterized membrane protein YGL010W